MPAESDSLVTVARRWRVAILPLPWDSPPQGLEGAWRNGDEVPAGFNRTGAHQERVQMASPLKEVSVIEHWHTSTARSDSRTRHSCYAVGLPARTADVRMVVLAGQNCQVAKASNFVRSNHATRGGRTHDFAPHNLAGGRTRVDGPADNAFMHREISLGG